MKRLLFILPLLVFAGVAVYFGFGLTRDPSKIPSALDRQADPRIRAAGNRGHGQTRLG